MNSPLARWASPLAAGLAFMLLLAAAMALHFWTAEAGLQVMLVSGFGLAPVREFAIRFIFTLLLPFYLFAGLLLWGTTLALASLFRRDFSDRWRSREGFLLTFSALLWVHLLLWWQVPSTLWLLPGLARIPFLLLFPLLALASLAAPVRWAHRAGLGWFRGSLLLACWLAVWSLAPMLPEYMPRLLTAAKGGSDPTQVLIIGLDGLRQDVGKDHTSAWTGTTYPNAYTVIPATRLLWHILWGGDPMFYTLGHAPPSKVELVNQMPLPLIDQAQERGWKPRFYIDDGGTIGLAGRATNFDDVLMPAPGWENFVNSNLSAAFPLFAAWENWGRAFPTTNPWAPLDGGLREALRLGRGAKLVMFHSCLAHVPIFLRRDELGGLRRWWLAAPASLEPYYARQQVTPARLAGFDDRRDPYVAYAIRMASILKAWEPIWNGLARDSMYGGATRVLFSDHGERFYSVQGKVRLSGVHGYDLDPWEGRIMMKVDGPGFATAVDPATVSVLSIRNALRQAIARNGSLDRRTLETAYPVAPLRYQTLSLELFTDASAGLFREVDFSQLKLRTGIARNGIWFTEGEDTSGVQDQQVSVGFGRGDELVVVKPLKKGGAYRYTYKGYELTSRETIPEADYLAAKNQIKGLLEGS